MGVADRFLDDERVTDRLIEEYEKYGRLIVAVDFDNTIFDFHKRGDTFPKVIEILRRAYSLKCKIIIYTNRTGERLEEVREYMKNNDIPYDTINEPILKLHDNDGQGNKLFYSIFLDDRAGLSSAYYCLDSALDVAEQIMLEKEGKR